LGEKRTASDFGRKAASERGVNLDIELIEISEVHHRRS